MLLKLLNYKTTTTTTIQQLQIYSYNNFNTTRNVQTKTIQVVNLHYITNFNYRHRHRLPLVTTSTATRAEYQRRTTLYSFSLYIASCDVRDSLLHATCYVCLVLLEVQSRQGIRHMRVYILLPYYTHYATTAGPPTT